MEEITFPFQKVAVDTCGPYPESVTGYKYLLTLVDVYSGWPEFYPLKDKSANAVGQIFVDAMIPRHGCPLVLLSDNGTEFVNRVVKEICSVYVIARITTSPYHPAANGKIERIHRVWNDIVAKLAKGDMSHWETFIPAALMAIRMSTHESTKYTPFYLMNSRDPILPLYTLLQPRVRYYGDEHHRLAIQAQHLAMTVVRRNVTQARERMKRNHDSRARDIRFEVGDPVYLHNATRQHKTDVRWKPYYRIIQRLTPVNFLIRDQVTGTTEKVHSDRLRLANLDWVLPPSDDSQRPRRHAAWAAGPEPPNEGGDGGEPPPGDDGSGFSSEDEIPLAQLYGRERADEVPLLQPDVGIGEEPDANRVEVDPPADAIAAPEPRAQEPIEREDMPMARAASPPIALADDTVPMVPDAGTGAEERASAGPSQRDVRAKRGTEALDGATGGAAPKAQAKEPRDKVSREADTELSDRAKRYLRRQEKRAQDEPLEMLGEQPKRVREVKRIPSQMTSSIQGLIKVVRDMATKQQKVLKGVVDVLQKITELETESSSLSSSSPLHTTSDESSSED